MHLRQGKGQFFTLRIFDVVEIKMGFGMPGYLIHGVKDTEAVTLTRYTGLFPVQVGVE